ncbi:MULTISPECIES: bestrophin family protein [Chryseobacterium]|uniref:bestrophin family protein n=1 Tax=Chryseobacterium TaxID=59732 RepID=UPI00195A353F|nr:MULTISPECIES: bestrophin family ion channel [Chryseobacterium]MDH6210207.1 putative membrane protein [Chryseobacterium sp. BIGb0186]WSO08924.1 bestrophin family ion channel [Chryseobacterium scophthalmum]
MIIRKKEHWFKMLFVWHGSVLPALLPRLSLLSVLSLGVVYFHGTIFSFKVPLNPAPLTLFGFVLALFLGFRNNVSYERFWEGRKLWGALLNIARSLTRQALTLKNVKNDSSMTEFIQLMSSFIFALKHQLRGTDSYGDLKQRLHEENLEFVVSAKYKPIVILKLMAEWVQNAKNTGKIDSIQQARFDENFDKLADVVGGCERIVSTPIPYSYRVLLHRTVYIYCALLPFGLVDSLGWFMPFIVVFVAYTFVAFEAIADEIEEPFGTDANDLALNNMCHMIDETIHELLGEQIVVSQKMTQNIID